MGAVPQLPRMAPGLSILVLGLLLASGFASVSVVPHAAAPPDGPFSVGAPASSRPAPAPRLPQLPLGSVIATLRSGAGPARGDPFGCTPTSPSTAQCVPLNPAPPGAYGPIAWNNESPDLAGPSHHPAAGIESSLAFDFADGVYVFFGGCLVTQCPSDQTWVYHAGAWQNVSSQYPGPPARTAAAMDYDFTWQAVVLYGGCGAICPLGDTWMFSRSSGWRNVTGATCASYCPAPVLGASMVWDSYDNVSVLFGGCSRGCRTTTDQTYELFGIAVGWYDPGVTVAPSPRGFTAMAYDPGLHAVLLFGGLSACGVAPACPLADTWSYQEYGGWVNRTSGLTGTPEGRYGAAMTWDGPTGEMVLTGGVGASARVLNSTWAYDCPRNCTWNNLTAAAPVPARAYMAIAENNSRYDPWFLGGLDPRLAYHADQWALGVAPSGATFTADPNPTDVGPAAAAWFNLTVDGGVGPYLQSLWFPGSGEIQAAVPLHLKLNFSSPGRYVVDATGVDAYGMLVLATATEVVDPPPTVALSAPGAMDAGIAAPFRAQVGAGTGVAPFSYAWSFGDSRHGTGASPTHTYAGPGTFTVRVDVTDRFGETNNTTALVVVHPDPTVTVTASPNRTDPGLEVAFLATGSLGSPGYAYAWEFGDGTTGVGPAPDHRFAEAGSYRVNVTLTDAAGGTARATVVLAVAAPLTATAHAVPDPVPAGQLVTFTASAAGGTGGYTFRWDFGDHSTGIGPNATHAYSSIGSYAVTLTVTDGLGSAVNRTINVSVTRASGAGSAGSNGPLSPFDLGLLAIVGLAVIAGVAVVLWHRRRTASVRPPPPSTPSSEDPPAGRPPPSP